MAEVSAPPAPPPGTAAPRPDADAQRTIRVARNAVSNYARFFGNGVVSFLLTPLMVHVLGDRDYGLWVTLFSLTGYFGLIDQGLRPSLVRYVSRERAAGDVEALSSTLSSALLIYTIAGLLVAAGTIGLAFGLGPWFHLAPQQVPVARATLILTGISLALGFPFSVFAAALSGLQRYDVANALGIVVLIVRALAFVVVLRLGGGLVSLAWVALASNILGYTMTMIAVKRLIPEARYAWRYVNRPHVRRIATYSGFAFIGALATSLAFKTDAIVITAFLGTALVTPFAIASGLVDNARTLVYSTTWVLSPTASELETLGERDKLQAMLVNGAKVSVLICWPVLFALMVFGDSLLATWVGASYRSAATLIVVLGLPTLVALPQSAASSVLFGVGRHRVVVLLAMLNALLNLGLSILWVRPFGLTGVALGTAVPLVIVGGFATGIYAARALELPLRRYFWEGMARPGIVSLAFLIPALALRAFWRPMGWGPLFLAVALPWLVFAVAAWRWAFNAGERARWTHAAPRVFGLARPAAAAGGGSR